MKKHIVMVSGGVGSFMELELATQEYGASNVFALFSDTKMEDPDLYRFLEDSINYLRVELVTLCDGRNPWEVFQDSKFIGNTRVDPCSRILKRELLNKWVRERFGPDECEIHFGIDYSEKHRIERTQKLNAPYVYRSLLVEKQIMVSREDKIQFCLDRGIEPPALYLKGFAHNNCGGFCVKAGLAQFKKLLDEYPDRYEWHVQQERATRAQVPNARPFLRKTINGKLNYIWLEDYRKMLLEGQELKGEEKFDFGGCGCALD